MAGVHLEDVSKSFDKVQAVCDVTITIADGEFFTLLGPSGCGKTTTLRMVAGLESPTRGRVFIGNRDVTKEPPKNRNVAMVFQNYALYPHMTVAENIGYPLRIRNKPRAQIDKRVIDVAESLAIGDILGRRPSEISGGQQQRAALARAIIHEPDVFLFDEPLSNLDAKLRADARTFLKDLQARMGITTVYVTHDQSEAMAMSDRVAVMDQGRVVQVGPPLEVYRRPASVFVADFLGNPSMNLLKGSLTLHAGVLAVQLGEVAVPLVQPPPGIDRLAVGDVVTLGLRPEDIGIHIQGGEDGIPGEVHVVEPLGSETLVSVKTSVGPVKVKVFHDMDLAPGDVVRLVANPSRVRLFDQAGMAIGRA